MPSTLLVEHVLAESDHIFRPLGNERRNFGTRRHFVTPLWPREVVAAPLCGQDRKPGWPKGRNLLTHRLSAVEMFVRDKYEKKKYTDKSVDLNVLKQREKLKEKKNEVKPAVVEKTKVEKSPELQGMHKAVRAKAPGLDMDLLGLDNQGWNESPKSTPTGTSGDLDIFGPMVSNPLPASTPTSQATVTTTAAKPVNQGQPSANDLNLFLDTSTQSEDGSKKTMSKDSILSLYGNQHSQCVPQGPVYLPPGASIAYMPSTAAPMAYPSVPVNAPQNAMIGVAPVGVPVGGSMSNGLMGNQLGFGTSAFAAGSATGTLGQSALLGYTSIANVPTWNMTQVSQQMSGLSVGMPGGMGAYSAPQNMSSWATSSQPNQALSTQVWK
uniref:stromal membrane-associated protein 1-like isoform X2 n=1 Tax=Myxine glutinosa TaxID=7769 RepID=UPI0035902C47